MVLNHIKRKFGISRFVTYRRAHLDLMLNLNCKDYKGIVLDVGGKKINRRGDFNPNCSNANNWFYLNLEKNCQPDIIADVENLPLTDKCVDTIIITEVLEHISDQKNVINELIRVLKENGRVFGSIPFLYPYHKDPKDYYRLTEDGLMNLLSEFASVKIYTMGGVFGTVGIILDHYGKSLEGISSIKKKITKKGIYLAAKICYLIDTLPGKSCQKDVNYTNGFFFICKK